MNRELTTHGLVVGRHVLGEGSLRVSLYTEQLGLVVALAKSAREERSKLRSHLQEGCIGMFTLVRGTANWRITGAVHTKNLYFELGERVEAKEALARVIATVRQFVRGEGNDPYFSSALFGFSHSLLNSSDSHVRDLEYATVLRLLASLGYVEGSNETGQFLDGSFDDEMLQKISNARHAIIRTINEGIAASGL